MMNRFGRGVFVLLACAFAVAQVQMPNPKEISGVPLPATDVPAGTVSVRVIRGSFENNLAGIAVTFSVDGQTKTMTTGADGRAQVQGLKTGANVKASVTVDGQQIESQTVTIASSGIRFVLVATDPNAAAREAADNALAAGPAVKGIVALGPETRVIVEPAEDTLNVFYVVEIVNTAKTPVDIGGPFVLDLPAEARGAGVMDGSSPQAKTNGTRLMVLGPFAPGSTQVQVGFGLPYSGGSRTLEQRWPVALPQVTVLMERSGTSDVTSPQLAQRREMTDSGRQVIVAQGPAIPAGQTLALEFTGLPHRPLWPRYTALAITLAIVVIGLAVAVRAPVAPSVPSREALNSERAMLLDTLAAIERDRAAGRLRDATYLREREAPLARLTEIYAALDAPSPAVTARPDSALQAPR